MYGKQHLWTNVCSTSRNRSQNFKNVEIMEDIDVMQEHGDMNRVANAQEEAGNKINLQQLCTNFPKILWVT